MKTKTITFVKDKDTKHMTRFNEVPAEGQPPVCNNIYIAKWFAGTATEVKITIEVP